MNVECLVRANPAEGNYQGLFLSDKLLQQGEISALAATIAETTCLLLLPSEEMVLTSVTLPASNRQKALAALPYALEEDLAEELENYFFALLAQQDQQASVAVLNRQQLHDWLVPWQQLSLQRALPDCLAIPWQAGSWSFTLEGPLLKLRTAAYQGFVFELADAKLLFDAALQQSVDNKPQVIHYYPLEGEEHSLKEIIAWAELANIPLEQQSPAANFLSLAAMEVISSSENINLLQGEFQPKNRSDSGRLWLASAATLILTLLVGFAGNLYHYSRLNQEAEAIDDKVLALYQKAFPGSNAVHSPRILIERELDKYGSNGASDPLILLAAVGQAMQTVDDGTLQNVNYHANQMVLNLSFSDFSSFEQFSQALAKDHIAVKRDSAISKEGAIQTRVVVSAMEDKTQ